MTVTLPPPSRRPLARVRSLPPIGVVLAGGVLAALVSAAVAPQLWTSVDPLAADPASAFLPSSAEHPFGTDQLGRDLFARVVHGASLSLTMGFGATLIGLAGGLVIGLLAGFSNGVVDRVLSRVIDILYSFPEMLLAMLAISVLGTGASTLLVAVGIGAIPGYARVLRAQVLAIRRSGWIEAATGLGLRAPTIAVTHVLPNAIGPVLVLATIGVGTAMIFGAALSFVGLGAQAPEPEWGLMLSESRNYLSRAWWLGVWPGLMLAATVVSVTVLGRWLQRRFVSELGDAR